ncbi:hypothetical protein MTO96_026529 [Rhipicephalus appendiculatus]
MAAVDLDRLCSRLSSIPADQLYCLDGDSSLPIPKIAGMSVPEAIAAIRASIWAIPDMNKRLECLCEIYACLMDNRAIGPWVLYHVPCAERGAKEPLMNRFLWEMNPELIRTSKAFITEERMQACYLAAESVSRSAGHEVYCLTFWTSSPCVAVYRPPEGCSDELHRILVNTLGGDPKNFERGVYLDQDASYQVAMSLAPPSHSLEDVGER